MIFFSGYMVGSIVFGILADKYGRRPIMSISFILMTLSSFLCSFGPQKSFGFWGSYVVFVFARFLLACSTRGISVSGFVLASEIGLQKKDFPLI
jgi:OCT family organic anion transporter-like MFS transporter 8